MHRVGSSSSLPLASVTRALEVFTLGTACLLAGCAPNHIALKNDSPDRSLSIKLVNVMPQPMVFATEPSTFTSTARMELSLVGGLIGGSFEAVRYRSAVKKLAPLASPPLGIEFRHNFADGLRRAAGGDGRLNVQEAISTDQEFGTSDREMTLFEMTEDALLVVKTYYYFTPNFQVFNVWSQAELWSKESRSEIYRGQWFVHSAPHGPEEGEYTVERVIAVWAGNQAAAYRSAEHDAIEQTALMELVELLHEPIQTHLGRMAISYVEPRSGKLLTTTGHILLRRRGWTIVRTEDGNLHALPSPPEAPIEPESADTQAATAQVQESGEP
jgi:hypothetical protein